MANVANEGIDLSSIKYCCFNEYFFVLSEDRENVLQGGETLMLQ